MVICWSCERGAGDGLFCAQCGAILPPTAGADHHFAVLGLPFAYDVNLKVAEENFRALSRRFHPDRFAKADPRARRASLQRSVQVNEAWRTIKDPVRRAEYLLQRAGYDIGSEEGASRPGGEAGQRERMPVPAALLGEILELREELGEAPAPPAMTGGCNGWPATCASGIEGSLQRVGTALAAAVPEAAASGESGRADAYHAAARELIALRSFAVSWTRWRCMRKPSPRAAMRRRRMPEALFQISEPGESAAKAACPPGTTGAIGIDLGTTNSLVAIVRDGVPTALGDDREGTDASHAAVGGAYAAAGYPVVGKEARDRLAARFPGTPLPRPSGSWDAVPPTRRRGGS